MTTDEGNEAIERLHVFGRWMEYRRTRNSIYSNASDSQISAESSIKACVTLPHANPVPQLNTDAHLANSRSRSVNQEGVQQLASIEIPGHDNNDRMKAQKSLAVVFRDGNWQRPQLTKSVAEKFPSPGIFPGDMRLPRTEYQLWLWDYLSGDEKVALKALYDDFEKDNNNKFVIANKVMDILVPKEHEVTDALQQQYDPVIVGIPRDPVTQLRRFRWDLVPITLTKQPGLKNRVPDAPAKPDTEYDVQHYPLNSDHYQRHYREWADFIIGLSGSGRSWNWLLNTVKRRMSKCATEILQLDNLRRQGEQACKREPFSAFAIAINDAMRRLLVSLEFVALATRKSVAAQHVITRIMFDGHIVRVREFFDEYKEDIDIALNDLFMDKNAAEALRYAEREVHTFKSYTAWCDMMGDFLPDESTERALIPRLSLPVKILRELGRNFRGLENSLHPAVSPNMSDLEVLDLVGTQSH